MPRLARIIPFAVALAVLAIVASNETRGPGVPPGDVRLDRATLTAPFVPNRGQTDPAVAFLASMGQGTLFVTRDGAMVLWVSTQSKVSILRLVTARAGAR